MGTAPHTGRRARTECWIHPAEGSDMHPHTPQERRAFESPEHETSPPPADRNPTSDRTHYARWRMLAAVILLAAIIALIVLL
jgi:hypothetical protein